MPIGTTKRQFTEYNINLYAEKGKGVYGLYDPITQTIYYGMSENSVRERLLQHLRGHDGKCTQSATWFNSEWAIDPRAREKDLLEEYRRANGKLPKCNDMV